MNLVTLRDGRLAIRVDNPDRLLTVPTMHPATPPAVRVQVLELVLRRLFGEALDLAVAESDAIEFRAARMGVDLAGLMSETPHHTPRRAA